MTGKDKADEQYDWVSLCLPIALHEYFLEQLNSGKLQADTGYEDYLSRIIFERMTTENPALTTPGVLTWEQQGFEVSRD